MFDSAALKALAVRKRLLVLESELNRQAVLKELEQLHASLTGLAQVVDSSRRLVRVLLLAAPVAGLLVSRKFGGLRFVTRAVLRGWRFWKHLESFRRPRHPS